MSSTSLASSNSFEARSLRRRVERRWLRTLRFSLVPTVLVFGLAVVLLINTIPLIEALSGFPVSIENEIPGRLSACVVALFMLQAAALWFLGVGSAILSRQAVKERGSLLRFRLRVIRRRFAFLAWAVLSLRIMILLVLVSAFVISITAASGLNVITDISSSIWLDVRYQPVTVALAGIVGLLSWSFGPFLRLRYSLALGALATTWSRRRDEQFWLTLSARLLVEMAGVLILVWAICMINLVTYITFDPLPGSGSPNSLPAVIGMLPLETIGSSSWLGALVFGSLYMLGQLVLPILFVRIARWRLQRRSNNEGNIQPINWSANQPAPESVSLAE